MNKAAIEGIKSLYFSHRSYGRIRKLASDITANKIIKYLDELHSEGQPNKSLASPTVFKLLR